MVIEYRELTLDDDFDQCVNVQRQVFGLSETDLVSPLIYKMIARNNPPLGVLVGAFNCHDEGSELIGLMLGFATFAEKSVYVASLGVLPGFRGQLIGYHVILKYREVCLARGIEDLYGINEPLVPNLGQLYFGSAGYQGIQYNIDTSSAPIPADKILHKWELNSSNTVAKLTNNRLFDLADILRTVPQAGPDTFPDASKVLMEIPADFIRMKTEDPLQATRIRLETRGILNEYINRRKFIMTDCLSGEFAGERKSFYVLTEPQAAVQANGGS